MCKHHWMIESTEADEAEGQCYNCGEVRTFRNQCPDTVAPRPNSRWAGLGEGGLPRLQLLWVECDREPVPGCYKTIPLLGVD